LERFTKADVDYLMAASGFIRSIPKVEFLDPIRKKGWRIQAEAFRKSEPNKPVRGLVVVAKAHQAPTGLPPPTPSAALEWYGRRIRGVNYELWHDNPDGSVVKGWHEHIWSPIDEDAYVVAAKPEPTRKALLDVLKWGLKKWNIDVQSEQGSIYDIE
jgi:hypothetical protein